MGYTHYWSNDRSFTAAEWREVQKVARKVIKTAKAQGIALQFESDNSRPPFVGHDVIRFNGPGDDGHETFYLTRTADEFSFCKTARKPYDAAVVAILQAAAVYCTAFSGMN